MVHSPGGYKSKDYLNPKISYTKGFLDSAILTSGNAGEGALPRPGFTPNYRDKNRHFTFD